MRHAVRRRSRANQIRGFWAAWGGWALDGMDSFIYALVLVPALTELLPRSGIAATPGNVGYYGSVLFALFLVGWGLSMVWGPVADRFGRVRTLMLTILCYSVFTFLGALATNVWQLAAFRAACRHRHRRRMVDGRHVRRRGVAGRPAQDGRRLHAHRLLLRVLPRGARELLHRRALRLARGCSRVGGMPALLVAFIRYGVRESARWQQRVGTRSAGRAARGVREAVLAELRAAHDREFAVPARSPWSGCGPDRSMCRRRSRTLRCASGYAPADAARAGVVRHDAAVGRHDPRLPRAAAAGRSARTPADAGRAISC